MSWATFFQLRQHLRQSLWAVPLLGTAAGAGLARVDLWLEGRLTLPPSWSYSAGTASTVLATIASAMVGLVGLVVTIGVLVVQMATGTLSPRFMRLWYRDRLQKLVLAAFIATFALSFTLLRQVETDSVPNLGVSMAGAAVTLDLFLLLVYLDRFVHALRPVAVGAAMADAGLAIVEEMLSKASAPATRTGAEWASGDPDLLVRARRSGAIQAIHLDGIVKLAAARSLVCVLPNTVGDFVTVGGILAEIYGPGSARDARRIRGMIALGRERTLDQDPAFALRILVDIAIRALSPAVNDPTTATQMVDHIGPLLLGLGSLDPAGRGLFVGPDGQVRLAVPARSWDDYLELGVHEIRRYGRISPQTCRRLRALLVDLEDRVLPGYRPAVQRQLVTLDRTVTDAFADSDEREFALREDRQGIGGASCRPGGEDAGGTAPGRTAADRP
jgi:uncharacterized membrane protein